MWSLEIGLVRFCKSLLCSMFNEQTCTRFTWLFGRSVVTMPKISLKTLYCYIFEKPKVQGHQNWYSQLSNTQIHKYKYKYTNTALLKCQEYQTYAIFLNSCWFKDVKNDIPKCPKWSDPTTDLTSDPISDPTYGPTSDPIYAAKNSNSKGIQSWYLKFSTHCVILHLQRIEFTISCVDFAQIVCNFYTHCAIFNQTVCKFQHKVL